MIVNRLLITVTIIFVGLTLRPVMAAVGPLLDQIRFTTGASFETAGLWTGLPIMAMGVLALGGSALYRLGMTRGITIGLIFILVGCLVRSFWFSATGLLTTAFVAGLGIGIIQVLMPGFIKHILPQETDRLMGIYVTAIMSGAAMAALLSPHFAQHLQWSDALAIWGILALIALLLWQMLPSTAPVSKQIQTSFLGKMRSQFHLIFRLRACLLAIFFGLMTCLYTLLLAWLAPFYLEQGWVAQTAGMLLAGLTLCSVFSGVIVSMFVSRWHDRRKPLIVGLLFEGVGFLCLLFIPQFAWLAIILLGGGLGMLFPLSLIVTLDHSSDPERAGVLAAFVQGVGYIIASFMPYLAGVLRDNTGGFALAWVVMFLLILTMLPIVWCFSPASIKAYDVETCSDA